MHDENPALRRNRPRALALACFVALLAFVPLNCLLLNLQMQQFSMGYGMDIFILKIGRLLATILTFGRVLAVNFKNLIEFLKHAWDL